MSYAVYDPMLFSQRLSYIIGCGSKLDYCSLNTGFISARPLTDLKLQLLKISSNCKNFTMFNIHAGGDMKNYFLVIHKLFFKIL